MELEGPGFGALLGCVPGCWCGPTGALSRVLCCAFSCAGSCSRVDDPLVPVLVAAGSDLFVQEPRQGKEPCALGGVAVDGGVHGAPGRLDPGP